jgi:hypothetical protein
VEATGAAECGCFPVDETLLMTVERWMASAFSWILENVKGALKE